MPNKRMNRCPLSLIIWKIKVKTFVRYHLIPIRVAITYTKKKKKQAITNVDEGVEKLEMEN